MFNFKKDNNIFIGDAPVASLVKKYGTPLIIYDKKELIKRANMFKNDFSTKRFKTEILYASKAASIIGIYKVLNHLNLSFDVVSSGEIFVAKSSGVDMARVYFHGNNKTDEEILYALENNVGTIMCDNFDELKRINKLTKQTGKRVQIIFRVNPHINAGANEKISTASDDSKFGESITTDFSYIQEVVNANRLITFRGFHAHIGSQIITKEPFFKLVDVMKEFVLDFKSKFPKMIFDTVNFGGGFGVKYTNEIFDLSNFLNEYISKIENEFTSIENIKRVMIEPGRSMVAETALTVYTVGGFKKTSSGKTHIYVDGGMTDNIRPSLYDAKYTFDIDGKSEELIPYIISGKCCESGDTLSKSFTLPKAKIGDLLVAYTTGAYTFSMSSNYNQLRKPGVLLVDGSHVEEIVKRQTYEDLIKNMKK